MLPEIMKRGHYVLKGDKIAMKIRRVKNSKEFKGEKLYVLVGECGVDSTPFTTNFLEAEGFDRCVTEKELGELYRSGEYFPSNGSMKVGKKLKG